MLESMDWTFWWNWIPESPKQRDEIDRLDVVGRNKTWKVQTDALKCTPYSGHAYMKLFT